MTTPTNPSKAYTSVPIAFVEAAGRLASKWLGLDDDSVHTPTDIDLARADKLQRMLEARMMDVAAAGGDPTKMTRLELLPDEDPDKLEISEADLC